MSDYYADRLFSEHLKKCYEIAPPRVRRYLRAELDHVLEKIGPGDLVLDLGCGYGRTIGQLAQKARDVIGIDVAHSSLVFGKEWLKSVSNCQFVEMNALRLGFGDGCFDVVACIQNGISAFQADERQLIRESVRVAKPGGIILFSSYAEKFWPQRLHWFELQASAGLLGEIDYDKSGDGVIVCRDGFKATTVSPDRFLSLTSGLKVETKIVEVDGSSLFCEITKPG